jgi:hypothetical protein
MKKPTLEERVAALEKEIADLRTQVAEGSRTKDWRRTIGMFTGDEGMQELFAEAMKIREADRDRARRRHAKARKRPAKS